MIEVVEALAVLAKVFLLSLVVEGLVEYFVAKPLKERGKSTFWVPYIGAVIGILVAVFYAADIFVLVGLKPQWAWAMPVSWGLTGLLISRGANYISDLLGKFLGLMAAWAQNLKAKAG